MKGGIDMNTIITIGRQFGSGGHEIGQKLADHYGIKCFDKELLSRAAKESGFCEEMLKNHDERPTNSFLYNLVMDTYSFGFSSGGFADMPINHKIFLAQFDTIKRIAEEGPCILVGRCADYALEHRKDVINIFIYADLEQRIKRIARLYQLTDAKAKDVIVKADKKRASYYNYYTNKEWGNAKGYDLCLNSGKLGVEGTVAAIKEYVALREKVGHPIL